MYREQLIEPTRLIALYKALGALYPGDTHGRYNSLIRRLVSFERALESRAVRDGFTEMERKDRF